jgi:hypothetical protein
MTVVTERMLNSLNGIQKPEASDRLATASRSWCTQTGFCQAAMSQRDVKHLLLLRIKFLNSHSQCNEVKVSSDAKVIN